MQLKHKLGVEWGAHGSVSSAAASTNKRFSFKSLKFKQSKTEDRSLLGAETHAAGEG